MIGKLARGGFAGIFLRWAGGLRFPIVFALTFAVFLLNVFFPDVIPFVDEIILGLVAILLANWKKKPVAQETEAETAGARPEGMPSRRAVLQRPAGRFRAVGAAAPKTMRPRRTTLAAAARSPGPTPERRLGTSGSLLRHSEPSSSEREQGGIAADRSSVARARTA